MKKFLFVCFLLSCIFPVILLTNCIAYQRTEGVWLIVIGISDYKYDVFDLDYAREDAKSFRKIMANYGSIKPDHIITILDAEATHEGIRAGILSIAEYVKPTDTVIIYYSGHISAIPDDNGDELISDPNDFYDEVILPYDANPRNHIYYMLDDDFTKLVKRLGAENYVFIFDACFSGGFTENDKSPFNHPENTEEPCKINSLIDDVSIDDEFDTHSNGKSKGYTYPLNPRICFLASSNKNQKSTEDHYLGHGVFTYYLLDAIKNYNKIDLNNDSKISLLEIYEYVSTNMKKSRYTQKPMLSGKYADTMYLLDSSYKNYKPVLPSTTNNIRETSAEVPTIPTIKNMDTSLSVEMLWKIVKMEADTAKAKGRINASY